jgi:hypothetical protein
MGLVAANGLAAKVVAGLEASQGIGSGHRAGFLLEASDGFGISAFVQRSDECVGASAALTFIDLGGFQRMGESFDDQFAEGRLALGSDDFCPVEHFIGKIDGRFH